MQKQSDKKIFFENIGGSFQFHAASANDLHKILELDSTAWAALCVPTASLNGDPEFFKALDSDLNGMIMVDEVKAAISWLLKMLNDYTYINQAKDSIAIAALNTGDSEGKILSDFVSGHAEAPATSDGILELAAVRAKLAAVTAGPLAGDGMLKAKAVEGTGGAALYADIAALLNCQDKLTADILEKFLMDAKSFVDWVKTTEMPLYRAEDPAKYYAAFKAVEEKIDEFFRYCELISIDPAHAVRFELDPAKLPDLDLQDKTQLEQLFNAAPLARPDIQGILDFTSVNNPAFKGKCETFAGLFNLTRLDKSAWQQLKSEFADYTAYLARAEGDLAGKLGQEKLEKYLAGTEADSIRELFAADKEIAGIVDNLRKLEKLMLFSRNMISFVNNFVSFAEFFDQEQKSMLQSGRLIMDGKSYNLAVWVDDIANHKKIAVRSNLCLLYLELTSNGAVPVKRKAAVAVTGGSLDRIYVGKPAFFVDNKNVSYTGKVVDMIDGPISFSQTLFAPFRRLSAALSSKVQKLTDFSGTEKQLSQSIEQGKITPVASPQPQAKPGFIQKLSGNGAMMMLAGGLSLAAVGAGLSFIFKSIASGIVLISALPWYVIVSWIAVFAAIILLPMAIFAFLRMRKRNLTMFLEAGGWAVNLPMRLNIHVSRLFTRGTQYPADCRFTVSKKTCRRMNRAAVLLLTALIITAAIAALYYFTGFEFCNLCSR